MTQENNNTFPFGLDDIVSWIIRRKDGTVIKYNLVSSVLGAAGKATKLVTQSAAAQGTFLYSGKKSFSGWCEEHAPIPTDAPIFEADNIRLFIANASGARKTAHLFDVAIDGGSVLTVPGEHDLPILYGDPGLCKKLARHVTMEKSKLSADACKILKIRWYDRCAPPVWPEFWPALLAQLKELQIKKGSPVNVVTICQGGHGRSGSALAALMMCLSDYTPLDALTHIRAVHCARAIESKDQHEYLNLVAETLGREQNALDAEKVKSFKEAFLSGKFEETYKERVRGGKGATIAVREAGYL
jgi:protein-tyrosine phosphatase